MKSTTVALSVAPRGQGNLRIALCCGLLAAWSTLAWAQTAPADVAASSQADERPLYEQKPFDLMVLDEANQNARLKIVPLALASRRPVNVTPDRRFVIRLLDNEANEYAVMGRFIRSLELYEEMLLRAGIRLLDQVESPRNQPGGKTRTLGETSRLLAEAYHHFNRVHEMTPDFPGLSEAVNRSLFLDAGNLNAQDRHAEAFAVVEELYHREPNYRRGATSRPLVEVMSVLLDRVLQTDFEAGNYPRMRSFLARVGQQYASQKLAAVDVWTAKLNDLARQVRDAAREKLDQKQYRAAFETVQKMLNIWPAVEGGQQLYETVVSAYPIVFVGVTQGALAYDAERLDNWAARRTGRLVHRTLVEFLGAGPEGGQYQLAVGSLEQSENRRQLILRVREGAEVGGAAVTGYDVARGLLQMASPGTAGYRPAWQALVTDIAVKNVFNVEVNLRRPHVLPEAFLRVRMPSSAPNAATGEGDGTFQVQSRTENETQFAARSRRSGELAEIVELTFTDSQRGLGALRRGEIDVLDRLFPADALRLRGERGANSRIRVEPYALPTVHILVPNVQHPLLANRDYRRAILLGINRQHILREELMGGQNYAGFQVISGPFPARAGSADPLGYGYDESILPLPYNPYLAKVLAVGAAAVVTKGVVERGGTAPPPARLVIGFPGYELARVAVGAISAQLRVIGINVELREFPPGTTDDPSGECDLVYKEIAMWEPVTDARRMLGPGGVAPAASPYVQQALRWLDEAENWSEARERLIDIHRAVFNDVALLPLWQTVDFFAHASRLSNVGSQPVWLYQHVDQWRLRASRSE